MTTLTPDRIGGSNVPTEIWAAVGGADKSVHHACTWAGGCHEHINDAIAEHDIEDAKQWVVRRYVLGGWQPIATAPRDGTAILLGIGDSDEMPGHVGEGFWNEGYPDGPDEMGHDAGWMDMGGVFYPGRSFGAESYRHKGYQPTHWMPLPPAPEKE